MGVRVEDAGTHIQTLGRDLERTCDLLQDARRWSTNSTFYLRQVRIRDAGCFRQIANTLLCSFALLFDEVTDVTKAIRRRPIR